MTERRLNLAKEMEVRIHRRADLPQVLPRLGDYVFARPRVWLSQHPEWLRVLYYAMRHEPFLLEARSHGETRGIMPLCYVRSLLFGRFLVGLPYLNLGGVVGSDPMAARRLIAAAADLANDLHVRYLELRHEAPIEHLRLTAMQTHKVHMRLDLPPFLGPMWESLPAKVRNQVRKGQKMGLSVAWGRRELLPEFYATFSETMRDLGTPVYPLALFAQILRSFPEQSEICVVRHGVVPVAAALLLHGRGVTEVPSAGSPRLYSSTSANMLMYWSLLERAIERNQAVFDFGRSTVDSGTFRFKQQWGARPHPAVWQYFVRRGAVGEMRPESPRYQRAVRIWKRLPLRLTQLLGPRIVRGIP